MTRTTVTCPFDDQDIPLDITFPMTPHGPVLQFDAPELVEHMKQHADDPIPEAKS